jgi:hypothetical protein
LQKITRIGVLLAGALSLGLVASAQQSTAAHTEFAVTYSGEYSKVAVINGNTFWLNGGSAEAAVMSYKGIGIDMNVTGENASNVAPGVNFSKIAYMAGPRYEFKPSFLNKKHNVQIFGEWLVGAAHGFNSIFPAAGGVTYKATAFSTQVGAGADLALAYGCGVRLLEVDYVHTALPNNAANSQNDLRIGFGVTYRR